MLSKKWIDKYVELAKHIASWSKDSSKKIGAIIFDDNHSVLSTGYNGFARGCNDDVKERKIKPLKYKWTEHAERNAIYNAARTGVPLKDSTMVVVGLFTCTDCARAIIQSGVKRVICNKPDFTIPHWGEDFKIAHEMLQEAKIEMIYI